MTPANEPLSSADSAEQLLTSLAGVVSAHVVADATGALVEIHVLADSEHHPKQVVRNVESALTAGLGLEIDRRIVSVAQIQSDVDTNGHRPASEAPALHAIPPDELPDDEAEAGEAAEPASQAAPRLEFVRYESRREDDRCTCSVILRSGDTAVTGEGRGPDTPAGRAEAAARAVFDGINQARPSLSIQLEAAVVSSGRGKEHVIVAAHAVLERMPVRLAGAAVLARSPEEAAILAALQASNRWSA